MSAKLVAAPASARPTGRMRGVLPTLCILMLVMFATPICFVLAILLLPTLLVRVTDPTPGHPLTQGVLLFGCAGAFPCLDRLWHLGNTLPDAIALGTDLRSVAACWALQAGGWLLGQAIPMGLAALTRHEVARQRAALEQRKAKLESDWEWK